MRTITFGDHLKLLRKAKGMSLRQVEEATGGRVSNGYLSQLETGKATGPSLAILDELAAVYGVDYHQLIDIAWPRRKR